MLVRIDGIIKSVLPQEWNIKKSVTTACSLPGFKKRLGFLYPPACGRPEVIKELVDLMRAVWLSD